MTFPAHRRPIAPPLVDLALGLGVGLLDLVGSLASADQDRRGPAQTLVGVALLLAAGGVLTWRRRAPFLTSIVVGALIVTYGVAELPDPPVYASMVLALATVAAFSDRWTTAGVLAVTLVASAVAVVLSADSGPDDYYSVLVPAAAALALGAAYRERLAGVARARQSELDAAVVGERRRIARDLHDVVAHHVSVMVVQAEAGAVPAEHAGDARTVASLDAISASGREALVELRRLLGVLRDEPGGQGTQPLPGLDRLPELVAQVERAGLPVRLSRVGERRPVDDGIEVSAYRIVQEALTNVVRHSGWVPTEVRVTWEPGWLAVEVRDRGTGSAAAATNGSGRGLLGIRERVALLGGDLRVGPGPDGGFHVAARLPTGVGPSPSSPPSEPGS